MSIPTVTYVTLNDTDKIGLSDTLDNYSIDDIKASGYVGAYDPLRTNCHTAEQISMWSGIEALNTPITGEWTGSPYPLSHKVYPGSGSYTGAVFSAVVWLYVDGNGDSHTPDVVINQSKISNYKLVTEMPANKMYYTAPNPNNWNNGSPNPASVSSWSENRTFPNSSYYAPGTGAFDYHSHYGEADDIVAGVMYTYPYMMYEFDGYFYFQLFTQQWDYYAWWMRNTNSEPDLKVVPFASSAMTPYTENSYISLGTVYNEVTRTQEVALSNLNFVANQHTLAGELWAGPSDWATVTGGCYDPNNSKYVMIYQFGGTGHTIDMHFYTTLAQKEDSLLFFANSGVKIIADKPYKPIITDGVVTGITDDMSEPSELDDWDMGNTDHGVSPSGPPTPPTPSGEDDIDSMGFDGMSCSVGGPAKYYIMSYSDIHHLIGDFNAHAEPGTAISNNIISCYVNALDWNWTTGSEIIEIYSGGAQKTAFTSDKNYAVLTGYNARDIIGSIDVPRMTNTFYDFSPYSTYEVYVPFCGWVALPDTVAGRHIKIYFETDEATCGCKGRVFFVDSGGNGVTVAEITGSFGAPCPIQVIEGGLYKGAMLSNGLQVIGGIASGVIGGASGSGVLAVGGLSNAMQGLGNCLVAGNTNYGQTIGRAGDASGLMCAGKPYLKITYPPVDEVVNNNMFAHTIGYLCNTIGQLSNFHGFTVCANPHVHISVTSTEKEEIKRLLEEGVILP